MSGVRPEHVRNAPSLTDVQAKVAGIIKGRVLVGHAIENDLKVLLLSHPRKDIRDTSAYPPFMNNLGGRLKPRALKALAKDHLGIDVRSYYSTYPASWSRTHTVLEMKPTLPFPPMNRTRHPQQIQEGEHSPVDDARVALYLYQKVRRQWEGALKDGKGTLTKMKERVILKAKGVKTVTVAGGEQKEVAGAISMDLDAMLANKTKVQKTPIGGEGYGNMPSLQLAEALRIGGLDQGQRKKRKGGGMLAFPQRPDLYDL